MGKIRCDAGARDARRGRLYPKYVPVEPVTPMRHVKANVAVTTHRALIKWAQGGYPHKTPSPGGMMYTPPKQRLQVHVDAAVWL